MTGINETFQEFYRSAVEMDLLNEHDLLGVFARLPIIDKIHLRSVSPLWKDLLEETLRTKQKVLADQKPSLDYCQAHRVQPVDIMPHPMTKTMSEFKLILKLCPNLEVLHIMVFNDSNEDDTEQSERMEPTFDNTFQIISLIAEHCPKLTCVAFMYCYPLTGGQGYYNLVSKFDKSYGLLTSCCPLLVHLNITYMCEDNHYLVVTFNHSLAGISMQLDKCSDIFLPDLPP